MTEGEWSVCDNTWRLRDCIQRLSRRVSSRKRKLFEVACCRQIWHVMTDVRCRRAIDVAEKFADGLASEDELSAVRSTVRVRRPQARTAGSLALSVAGGNIWFPAERLARELVLEHAGVDPRNESADQAAESRQAVLFRDIFGNPFRPVRLDPSWLAWNDGAARKLAQAIYDGHRFADLPLLADALEEAGCAEPALLAHCREPGEHVRGCWAVDLLLGKG